MATGPLPGLFGAVEWANGDRVHQPSVRPAEHEPFDIHIGTFGWVGLDAIRTYEEVVVTPIL